MVKVSRWVVIWLWVSGGVNMSVVVTSDNSTGQWCVI